MFFRKIFKSVGDFFVRTLPRFVKKVALGTAYFFTKTLPKVAKIVIKSVGGFFVRTLPRFVKKVALGTAYFFTKTLPKVAKIVVKSVYKFFWQILPRFLKKTFVVTYSLPSKIVGSILCLAGLLLVILRIDTFSTLPVSSRWLMMATDLALPFLIAVCTIYTIRFRSELARKISGFVIMFLMPILLMTLTEVLNSVFVFKLKALGFFGNYFVILLLYFIMFAISGSFKITYLTVNTLLVGLATAHCYIMEFRGSPFQPFDFHNITTAAGVANTYDFAPNYKIITGAFVFIILNIICIKMKTPKYTLPTKLISRSALTTFTSIILILFYSTDVFTRMGVAPNFWNQAYSYKNYGFVLNFFLNTKYVIVREPADYDSNEIEEQMKERIESNEDFSVEQQPSENAPNIICIMNESLSDLRVLGDFETNEEYMPFLNSLTENTIKGNLYVPVIGAGTSNTEFEFLTGHTTAFLPTGSNAYMLYVKEAMPSLTSTLEAQNYSSFALHPYYASGWRRTEVYSSFGFNDFISLEDIMDVSLMDEYQSNGSDPNYLQKLIEQNYPGKDMLIRQYVSDAYNYDLLIQDFEKRDKTQPYYAFNVTMQNHGGYTNSCVNFPEDIKVTSSSKEYPKVNQYLSLVKQSDTAFKELVSYFSKVKEPTIICMFGDHQPTVEPGFIEEIMGVDSLSDISVKQEQQRHITPFYIWANYDIPEETIEMMSVNYLSSLLLQTAGAQLTDYNKYLLTLRKSLPVINPVGYIDANGKYYKRGDVSSDEKLNKMMAEYEKIQYNAIFDKKKPQQQLFYLKDYVHEASQLEEAE